MEEQQNQDQSSSRCCNHHCHHPPAGHHHCGNHKIINGNFVPLIQNKVDNVSSTYVNNPLIPLVKPLDPILKNKKYQVIIGFDKDIKGNIWPEWMYEPVIHALKIDSLVSSDSEINRKLGVLFENVQEISANLADLSGFQDLSAINELSSLVLGISANVDQEIKAINVHINAIDSIIEIFQENVDNEFESINEEISNLRTDLSALDVTTEILHEDFEHFKEAPATVDELGVVRSSDSQNKISVLDDGTMEVNSISVSKLVSDPTDELILLNPSLGS